MSTWTWRNRARIDLPMRMADHDPVNGKTINRGRQGATNNFTFGVGANQPTKLAYRRGYSFDGNDRLIIDNSFAVTPGAFSILFTFMNSAVPTVNYLGDHRVNAGGVAWLMVLLPATINFYVGGAAAVNAAQGAYTGRGQVSTVVGRWDGTNTMIFIDGEYRATAATPLSPSGSVCDVNLGTSAAYTNGWIGHLYNYIDMDGIALSPSQVSMYHREMMAQFHQI